jgi:hypothetical protein
LKIPGSGAEPQLREPSGRLVASGVSKKFGPIQKLKDRGRDAKTTACSGNWPIGNRDKLAHSRSYRNGIPAKRNMTFDGSFMASVSHDCKPLIMKDVIEKMFSLAIKY